MFEDAFWKQQGKMKREYPDHPVVGVGGVIFHESRVLLARRAQDPGKGTWSFPGGVVEIGETVTEALHRELWEEVSIRVEIGGLVRVLDRIIRDEEGSVRFHYIIIDYWGRLVSGSLQPGSDISEAVFVPLDQIHSFGVHRDVEETAFMAQAMLRGQTKTGKG